MGVEVEVGDGVLVGVAVGVSVGVGVNVGVGVLVGTGVDVDVGVKVGVAVDVGAGVTVGVEVGISVSDGEAVAVAVGCCGATVGVDGVVGTGDGGVSDSSGAVKTKGVNCGPVGLSVSFPDDQQPAAPADRITATLHQTICVWYRLNTAVRAPVHFPFSKLPRPAT